MPTAWRVHAIESALAAEGLPGQVSDCDVYALPAGERTHVVDVLIAERTSFPMVLVDDEVVCHAGVELEAVVSAVRERSDGASCC
jgi:disulfide oxidoreductase YuzD